MQYYVLLNYTILSYVIVTLYLTIRIIQFILTSMFYTNKYSTFYLY